MVPNPDDRIGGADELEFEPIKGPPAKKGHWGRWIALLVVVIVGAGGGWFLFGDQLELGDQRSVPLIQAEITPVKARPADPGGMDVPDRDKLVYGRLKGEGAGTNVERLLPPPEELMEVPPEALQPSLSEPAAPAPLSLEAVSEPVKMLEPAAMPEPVPDAPAAPVAPTAPAASAAPTALEPAVVEPTSPDLVQLAPDMPTADAPQAPVAVEATPVAPEPAPAPKPEPEPAVAPQPVVQQQTTATPTGADMANMFRIQLAALRSHERAETEWKRLRKAYPDLLGSLKLSVMRVDLGEDKGVFYRLRAGPFDDKAKAKDRCSKLSQHNVGCLVIRPGK